MLIQVKQNNWILPLRDEQTAREDDVRLIGLRIRMAHEVPVIFHQLNTAGWWWENFEKRSYKELQALCRYHGLQTTGNKRLLVSILSKYWRDRIRNGSAQSN